MAAGKQAEPRADASAPLDAEVDRALLGRSLFVALAVAVVRDLALMVLVPRLALVPGLLVELFVLWRLAICVGFWPFPSAAWGVAAPVVALALAWMLEGGLSPWGSGVGTWLPVALGFLAVSVPPARAIWIALDWVRKWEAAERMGIVHRQEGRKGPRGGSGSPEDPG